MKNYKETFISKQVVSELDLDPPFWEIDEDEPNLVDYCEDGQYQDAPSMDIEDLIHILETIKRQGANRVYIESDNDHQGYEFTFVNLTEV